MQSEETVKNIERNTKLILNEKKCLNDASPYKKETCTSARMQVSQKSQGTWAVSS